MACSKSVLTASLSCYDESHISDDPAYQAYQVAHDAALDEIYKSLLVHDTVRVLYDGRVIAVVTRAEGWQSV